ncbi:activity-dependent neuroprotector homeobox protein 2b [Myripristis murdjan]|uniref:ADNP homeobox 2b n=1 Tax=Myripristis murdjan TaxID=586833 RepID=A0A667WZQ3_9TELE|nr:activity-dependent neuroprotector homeobox protein 2 [Myripristis murdjan]XP_029920295.1 activity-dependent neuroprotector homeobox protein 2 [Myripristis murdjan]
MFQLPVENIDKVRKTRRKVKNILCEIGLEDCQNLLKDLREKSEKNVHEEEAFQDTEWVDLTDGFNGKLRKKWPYRSRALCCNLCKYSTRSIYNFKSHVTRNHEYERSVCALAPCTQCHYVGHPRAVKRHMLFFHSMLTAHAGPARDGPLPTHRGNERYQCRKCGFPSSSIFAMKKHVILKHLESLAEQFIGYRVQVHGTTTLKTYFCKVCKVITGNLDQMLHHMLVEPSHYWVNTQVQGMITENKNYIIKPTPNGNGVFVTFPSIAPKPQQPQAFSSRPLVLPNNGQQPGTVVTLQQVQGASSSTTLICTPGTNQAFLPPQASALVQLASAEAKGLLQPGATIALKSALPQGAPMVQFPTMSNVPLKQAPLALAPSPLLPGQPPQNSQILLPPGLQANVTVATSSASQPAVVPQKVPSNQFTLQGTMLTSQSLLSHLIPTGNKVNGMPTYTFAPLQVAMPVSQSTSTPLKPVEPASNSALQTKKWITCPLCNELFPSNVYDMHTEVAHKTKSTTSKSESVAARAPFLKKMPDKTVKCLMCKILLSEKGVFQHLLHGLNCLYCSSLFFSIKQLVEHVKEHNPTNKAYCDFIRREYRVYTNNVGRILFPYFDVNTTAPKEVLGDNEVNLALVTNSLDLIFLKMLPSSQPEICQTPVKINSAYCPFCDEKFQNAAKHLQHLKQKHFVAPTIHAILNTEAFKCIYCNGVYTGKVTQQAVMLHIQRCRCSPKQPEPPKTIESNDIPRGRPRQTPKPPEQISQPQGLYFLQMPQAVTMKQTLAPAPPLVTPTVSTMKPPQAPPESEAELQCKKRLEAAWKEVMEANKREREERAAMRRRREQEKLMAPPEPEFHSDPTVKLVLEPTVVERRSAEERRDFISRYFHLNPYATKVETEELCKRLTLTKAELAAHFGNKRSKCMKSLKRSTAVVLLGFNMTELSKVKHNLLIPEVQPTEVSEQTNKHKELEPVEESADENVMESEPME